MTEIDSSCLTLCRICARPSNTFLDLFNDEHNGEKLVEMLAFCVKQIIHEGDGLPGIICDSCGSNLIVVHEFHTLCNDSEQRFREILAESENQFPALKVEVEYGPSENEIKVENEGEVALLPNVAYYGSDINFVTYKKRNIDLNYYNEMGETESDSQFTMTTRKYKRKQKPKTSNERKKSLKKLFKKQRLDIDSFECFQCKKVFRKLSHLHRHTKEHVQEIKPYECSECKIRFVYSKSLFRHRRQKHPTRVYECEHCTEAFDNLTKLKKHLGDSHKAEMQRYKCNLCSKDFVLQFQFLCHQSEHLCSKQISCKICKESFSQQRMLKSHIRDKHTNHLCSECGKTFKTIHLLASHQNLHKSDTPFACDQCPNRFKWKAALTTHMLVHTGQKKHVCDTCGSSFTTKGSLNKHHLIHTGTRPFPCDTCSMRFYSKDHLKRHIRTHSGEKPYKCKFCDRAFSQSNDLTKHTRSHVGQYMYKCPECPKAFRLQTELRNHSFEHYEAAKKPVKPEQVN